MQMDHRSRNPRLSWAGSQGPRVLLARVADDPWALSLEERWELGRSMVDSQERWLRRLPRLVEPPAPDRNFPAFLLDLPLFCRLSHQVGDARHPGELSTAAADELQRFADLYRDYLISEGGPSTYRSSI